MLEKQKDSLRDYIACFEERRDPSEHDEDVSDLSSQPSVLTYKRQQPVQY